MNEQVYPPLYLQIALDIASRIASNELKENSRIYGRSIMSSEYGVSPETIRRALKLLADMDVVEIIPKSGVVILSGENAKKYVERFSEKTNIRNLQSQLKNIITQHNALGKQIVEITTLIAKINDMASPANPFQNYELEVPEGSHLAGKSIGEVQFWQATGATIIAIRRGEKIILSPGPYAEILPLDVLVFICDNIAISAAEAFITMQ